MQLKPKIPDATAAVDGRDVWERAIAAYQALLDHEAFERAQVLLHTHQPNRTIQ